MNYGSKWSNIESSLQWSKYLAFTLRSLLTDWHRLPGTDLSMVNEPSAAPRDLHGTGCRIEMKERAEVQAASSMQEPTWISPGTPGIQAFHCNTLRSRMSRVLSNFYLFQRLSPSWAIVALARSCKPVLCLRNQGAAIVL